MTVNNVSTYGSLQTLLQNMGDVQSALNDDQQEISSGEVSQTFQGLGGNVEQYTSFNAQLSRLTNYQQDNTTLLSQMQATNTALSSIETIANNVKSLIASQTSGSASAASFQQQLQSQMTALSAALNTTYGSSYLFGGTDTSTPPVKSDIPTPASPGTLNDDYYQGSDQDITARVADDDVITPNVRADNTAFQQLYAGIQEALSSSSTDSLTSAENLVNSGLQGVIGLQATVNANIVNVQAVNTQNQTEQTYLKGLVSTMSSADVVTLSTQVAQDQSVLEATYSTFSRISSLSIVSYLPTT